MVSQVLTALPHSKPMVGQVKWRLNYQCKVKVTKPLPSSSANINQWMSIGYIQYEVWGILLMSSLLDFFFPLFDHLIDHLQIIREYSLKFKK